MTATKLDCFFSALKESAISKIVGRLLARKLQQLRPVSSDFSEQGSTLNSTHWNQSLIIFFYEKYLSINSVQLNRLVFPVNALWFSCHVVLLPVFVLKVQVFIINVLVISNDHDRAKAQLSLLFKLSLLFYGTSSYGRLRSLSSTNRLTFFTSCWTSCPIRVVSIQSPNSSRKSTAKTR